MSEVNHFGPHVPARSAAAVTPSDSVNLTRETRGIYVGVSGDVKVIMADDGTTTTTFVGLAAGVVHPLRVKRVYATLTTATSIVGVY
jgi:hypothetical protein